MKALPVQWLKNLSDPKKRIEVEAIIRNSTTALSRLLDIVEEKEQSINSQELAVTDFESPAWSHKTAYRLGQKAALKELKDLLAFTKG